MPANRKRKSAPKSDSADSKKSKTQGKYLPKVLVDPKASAKVGSRSAFGAGGSIKDLTPQPASTDGRSSPIRDLDDNALSNLTPQEVENILEDVPLPTETTTQPQSGGKIKVPVEHDSGDEEPVLTAVLSDVSQAASTLAGARSNQPTVNPIPTAFRTCTRALALPDDSTKKMQFALYVTAMAARVVHLAKNYLQSLPFVNKVETADGKPPVYHELAWNERTGSCMWCPIKENAPRDYKKRALGKLINPAIYTQEQLRYFAAQINQHIVGDKKVYRHMAKEQNLDLIRNGRPRNASVAAATERLTAENRQQQDQIAQMMALLTPEQRQILGLA